MPHVIYDLLTLKQFLRLPEAKPALEYFRGKVTQKMAAKRLHSTIQSDLGVEFALFLRGRGLGRMYDELRCTFDGASIVPDLCYIAPGRFPRGADGRLVDDFPLPPDFLIEVVSPGQTVKDLTSRLNWCVAHGVRLAWLIRPRAEQVVVLRPDVEPVTLGRGDTIDAAPALDGFSLSLDTMFDWLLD